MAKEGRSSFLTHAATYAVGNVARRVVGFAMLPIYTRFLSPADYGVLGLLAFALAFVEPLFGAKLVMALPKFYFELREGRDKRAVIWAALSLTGLASALSVIGIIVFRGIGSEILFGDRKYSLALAIFSVTLWSRSLEDTGMMYLRMHERSRLFLTISMIKLVVQVGLNLLLVVYLEKGVVGAVLSGAVSSVLIGVALTGYVARREAPTFDWKIARSMLQFSWPLWVSGLAGLYVGASGGIYLRVFGSLGDVGRLELALRFASVVGLLIWTPFSQQWAPLSYKYFQEPNGKEKFQVAFIGIASLMFIGGVGVSIFARPVINLMATTSFRAAASAVPILILGLILNQLRSFFNFSFLATGHTKASSICQYVMAVAITISYINLVPAYGLEGAAIAQGIAFLVGFAYAGFLSRRYYDPGLRVAPLAVFMLVGTVAYICSNVLVRGEPPPLDFALRSVIFIAASGMIALVGMRAIKSINVSVLDALPWPLSKFLRTA